MKTQVLLWVQLVLAAMLMWTCFCRLTKTGPDTFREVRWAILFEGMAAGLVFMAPVLPILMPHEMRWPAWSTPVAVWILLLLSVTLVQMVTAKHWKNGQAPAHFQQGAKAPGGVAFAMVLLALGFLSTGSTPASAQPGQRPELPFTLIPPGAYAQCVEAEGCAAMPLSDLKKLLDMAEAAGRADCPKTGARTL